MTGWNKTDLLCRFSHLKHEGFIEGAKTATLSNPMCGDRVTAHVGLECDTIKGVKFTTIGCVVCTVVADLLAEAVLENNYTAQEVLDLEIDDFLDGVGMTLAYTKTKCANLSLRTLKEALGGKDKIK